MPDVDFFNFWRYLIGWVVTIYASILTFQSLYGWWIWLAGSDRYMTVLRQYVIIHGLRLRFKTFWGDVLICILLTVAFFILWHGHHVMNDLGDKLHHVRRLAQSH